MSRYRMVHCAIWSDDKFPFLSDDAQLVWFHLYTNEFTTACGIYKAPLEGLAADKRWPLKRYREGFRECLEQGLVEYDERLYVIAFPRFFTWNRPANPNVLQNWLSAWEAVPRSPLKRTHYQRLAEACKRWGEGFEKVSERFAETLPPTFEEPSPKQEQEQEKEQEQDITPPSPPSSTSDDDLEQQFETWWQVFPRYRRGPKGPAKRKWMRIVQRQRATPEELIEGLRRYNAAGYEKSEFAQGAERWLNSEQWTVEEFAPPGDVKKPGNGQRLGMAQPAPAEAFQSTEDEIDEQDRVTKGW